MKDATDAVGNPLHQGSLVAIKLGDQVLVGYITQYSQGGIALVTGGNPKPQQTPGQLLIEVKVPMAFEPGARIGVLYALLDPNAQALIDEAVKKAKENTNGQFIVPGSTE